MRSKGKMLLIACIGFVLGGCTEGSAITESGTPLDSAAITALVVTPTSRTLRQGESLRLMPLLTWRGESRPVPMTWTSSNPQIASVATDGMATAKEPGAARITLVVEGYTASS